MPRRDRTLKTGLPPGTPTYIGQARSETPRVEVLNYNREHCAHSELTDLARLSESLTAPSPNSVRWLRVRGLHDVGLVTEIAHSFQLHAMTVEDILHTEQRPRLDEYNAYTFIELDQLSYANSQTGLQSSQVSIVAGEGFVLSFEEVDADVFAPIVQRLLGGKGRVRAADAHYLCYALLDVVVDNYILAADALLEEVLAAEQKLLSGDEPGILETIYELRRTGTSFRGKLVPTTDIVNRLRKLESFGPENEIYVRELSDHILTAVENVRGINEISGDMLNLFMSQSTHHMNEIMKTLTIVGAIFIPLTFVVGVFGMNFQHMPELKLPWAYPATLVGLGTIAAGMLFYFRRRGWI